jgi:hypothetical protein
MRRFTPRMTRDNGRCHRLGSADRARDAQRCFHRRWNGMIDRRRQIQSGQPSCAALAPEAHGNMPNTPLVARAEFPRHRFRQIDQRRAQLFVGDFDEGFGEAKRLPVKRD